MFHKKTALCAVLAVAIFATLTACSKTPQETEPTTVPTTAPTVAPTTDPTTLPTTAPTTAPTAATTAPTAPSVPISTLDDAKILSYINTADALAQLNNYDQALEKVAAGLAQFPDSPLLKAKQEELLAAKDAYISFVIDKALAEDHRDAYLLLCEAITKVGGSTLLQEAADYHAQAHIMQLIESAVQQTDLYAFDEAKKILNEALDMYPDNPGLQAALAQTESAEKIYCNPSLQNPNQNPQGIKAPDLVTIIGGSSKHTALAVQRQDIHTSTFSTQKEMWYTFTTSGNYSVYQISLWNKDIPCYVYFRIYDDIAATTEIYSVRTDKGGNISNELALTPDTQYWIKVNLSATSYKGSYQFSINEKICDAGTDKANAFYVDLNKETEKYLDLAAFDDWFRFRTGKTTSACQILLTNVNIDSRIHLDVYDANDTKIGTVSGLLGSISLDLPLNPNQEYTFVVRQDNQSSTGRYTITVTETEKELF